MRTEKKRKNNRWAQETRCHTVLVRGLLPDGLSALEPAYFNLKETLC